MFRRRLSSPLADVPGEPGSPEHRTAPVAGTDDRPRRARARPAAAARAGRSGSRSASTSCLGLAATGLLIAQAVIVATLVAGAFDGRPVADAGPAAGRAGRPRRRRAGRALAGSVETIGRWAAARVMSDLRLRARPARLRERRQRDRRSARTMPAERGDRDRGGRRGRRAGGLPRPLPAAGRAVGHGAGRGTRHRAGGRPARPRRSCWSRCRSSPCSWRSSAAAAGAAPASGGRRWRACRTTCSTCVRGLPTLRAYNRADAQADLVAESGERYRRRHHAGAAAVVPVRRRARPGRDARHRAGRRDASGVRLIGGGLDLRAALIVLLLTPELYAPLRALGALFHASTDGAGRGRAHPRRARDRTRRRRPATAGAPDWQQVALAGVTVEHPDRGGPVLHELDLRAAPRRGGRARRAQRRRQEHGGRRCSSACAGRTPAPSPSTAGTSATLDLRAWRRRRSGGSRSDRRCSAAPSARTSPSATRGASAGAGGRGGASWPASASSSAELRRGYDTVIGPAGAGCRPASSAASRWPGRCCGTRAAGARRALRPPRPGVDGRRRRTRSPGSRRGPGRPGHRARRPDLLAVAHRTVGCAPVPPQAAPDRPGRHRRRRWPSVSTLAGLLRLTRPPRRAARCSP